MPNLWMTQHLFIREFKLTVEISEAYAEPSRPSKLEFFTKIVKALSR